MIFWHSALLNEAFKYSGCFDSVCYKSALCSTASLDGRIMPVHVLRRLHKALWASFYLHFFFSPVVCLCPHFHWFMKHLVAKSVFIRNGSIMTHSSFSSFGFIPWNSFPDCEPNVESRNESWALASVLLWTGCQCQIWWRRVKGDVLDVSFQVSSVVTDRISSSLMTLLWPT